MILLTTCFLSIVGRELVFLIQYFVYAAVTTEVTATVSTQSTVIFSSRVTEGLTEIEVFTALALTLAGSTETYSSFVFNGSLENTIAVETSVQLTLTETIVVTAYTELEGLFLDAMIAVDVGMCCLQCKLKTFNLVEY